MLTTTEMLLDEIRQNYSNPKAKLSRLVKQGIYTPVVRGLYETDKTTPGYLLAGSIYGPSYISFDYALARYGIIPEAVYTVTSATFEKKKRKIFKTPFGTFSYQDVPSSVFHLNLRVEREGDYFYRIAEPEKALCDKLFSLPTAKNARDFEILLFENLRIDEHELWKLNTGTIENLSRQYRSRNIRRLSLFLLLNRFFFN